MEVGAGIGDHTSFFLDRGCSVLSTEPRAENCHLFGFNIGGHPRAKLLRCAVESFDEQISEVFDIVYAYGLLYHVADPKSALETMARRCSGLLLLETCVSLGNEEAINPEPEPQSSPSQAVGGMGCRPTRPWILNSLKKLFPHVYVPATQPAHEEFPLDWITPAAGGSYYRAVFVASRKPLSNAALLDHLPDRQTIA